jgi:hypothetical protein
MPRYRIRMINSEFESFEEADYPSLDAARQMAISAATRIAAESLLDGVTTTAIEVEIHEQLAMVARHVVTLSVADLSGGEAAGN